MAEFPAMPLWTDAYLGDTRHLSTIQHGAYLLLLIVSWRNGGDLPDNDRLLARYAGLTGQQWSRMRDEIRAFFVSEDGRIFQPRLRDEYDAVRQLREKRSAGGHATALKNKERHSAKHRAKHADSMRTHTHTHLEKDKDKSLSKKSARVLSPDWSPKPFEKGKCAAIIGAWSEDRFNHEVEAFKAHHGSRANAFVDWQQAWQTWVLNADKFDRKRSNGAGPPTDTDRTTGAAGDAFGDPSGWSDRQPMRGHGKA